MWRLTSFLPVVECCTKSKYLARNDGAVQVQLPLNCIIILLRQWH